MIKVTHFGLSNEMRVKVESGLDAMGALGHLHLLKWAKRNQFPLHRHMICLEAAKQGYLDIIKWGKEKGLRWKANLLGTAAEYDQLEVVKWALEMGCKTEFDNEVCFEAARNGNLEMLKHARSVGCKWDDQVYIEAIANGRINILEYAVDNNLRMTSSLSPEYVAISFQEFRVLEWLISRQGVENVKEEFRESEISFQDIMTKEEFIEMKEWIENL